MRITLDIRMTAQFYKWLKADGSAPIGRGNWHPGKWRSVKGKLVPCKNGLHLCRRQDLLLHISERLWIAEADTAEMIEHEGNKIVVRRARILRRVETINDCTMRLFACDCADRVVFLTESDEGKNCIAVARRYAHGEATDEELAEACDAASRAACDAGGAASRAGWAAAWTAASDAARAASDTARAASHAAIYTAASDAQVQRFIQYIEHGAAAETMPWPEAQ
jgi:hypothetical protein